MRYELTDDEWTAIKPMLPNKPRGVAAKTGVQTNRSDQNRPAARRGFYLACPLSALNAPPSLRCTSLNCDRTNP